MADFDEFKRESGDRRMTDQQQSCLLTTKIVLTIVTVLSAIVALILVIAAPETFTINLMTTTDYRVVPPLLPDGYPNAQPLDVIGTANVGLIAAFVSVIGFLGFLIVALFHSSEVEQLNRGANPWFWIFSAAWTPIAFLTWQFISGIHNVYIHVLLFLAVWGWIFLFWNADLLNSYGYKYVQRMLAANSNNGGSSMWSWLPIAQGLIFAITTYVVIFIYLGFTFSADIAPPTLLIWSPIVGMVLYLILVPVVLVLFRNDWLITSLYYREMTFYIASAVIILVATWLTLVLFAACNPLPGTPGATPGP